MGRKRQSEGPGPPPKKKKRTEEQISDDEWAKKYLRRQKVSTDAVDAILAARRVDVGTLNYRQKWEHLLKLGLIDRERFVNGICVRNVAVKCKLENIASTSFVNRCRRVATVASNAARRAGLLANLILLRAHDEGVLEREVPILMCKLGEYQKHVNSLFRRCTKEPHPFHVETEAEHADVLPSVDGSEILTNGIQGALRVRFVTGLKCHWKTHFGNRLQHYLECIVKEDKRFSFESELSGGTRYKIACWNRTRLGKWYLVRKDLAETCQRWPEDLIQVLRDAKEEVHVTPKLLVLKSRLDSDEEIEDDDEEDDEGDGIDRSKIPWAELVRCHISIARWRESWGKKSFTAAPVPSRGVDYLTLNETILGQTVFKDVPFDLQGSIERLRKSRTVRRGVFRRTKSIAERPRKKKGNGIGKWSGEYVVRSVATDGVGCSIIVRREYRERNPIVVEPKEDVAGLYDRLRARAGDVPRIVGIDPGRRNLFFSSENLDGDWERMYHRKHMREHHLRVTGQEDFSAWELSRRERNRDYSAAMTALSIHNSKCCNLNRFMAFIHEDFRAKDVLEAELQSTERSEWRFRLKRGKRTTLDRCARKVILGLGQQRERPVIVCYGAAKMKAGGKGERSVPVNECAQAFYRAVRTYGMGSRVVKVDEFRTTAMCRRCHRKNEKVFRDDGRGRRVEVLDYRICRGHLTALGNQIPVVRLDRDRLGSINIGIAGEALVKGLPRPEYLRRPGQS